MRFEFYSDAIDNVPKLSVDGTVPNSIHFSHWNGNETPSELKADTSTEIALNLVTSPNRDDFTHGIDLLTNNHFGISAVGGQRNLGANQITASPGGVATKIR